MAESLRCYKERLEAKILVVLVLSILILPFKAYAQEGPEICKLELMATHIEYQGDLFVGCEFSSGRVDIKTIGTLTLTHNSQVVIEGQDGPYEIRAEYQVIPDSPGMFYCYRQVVNATGALVRITNTATGEVCEPDLVSNKEEVYADFHPDSFTAWIRSGGIETDLLLNNLVRTELSTLEPEPLQQQTCEEDYWKEQFRIMAAKRDEQKARGDRYRAALTDVGAKRDIWKARALGN